MTREQILNQIHYTCQSVARDSRDDRADVGTLLTRMAQTVAVCRAEMDTETILPSPPLPLARPVPVAAGEGE